MEENKNEIWKPIPNYEGLYDLSNKGVIYTYPRPHSKSGYSYGTKRGKNYLGITLTKNGIQKSKYIHKLVYEMFIGQIPKGYDVHHKDHNKHNNFVYVNEDGSVDLEKSNLELVPHNKHYIEHIEDIKNTNCKPVLQYTKDGKFVAEYSSESEAANRNGISQTSISNCCNNKTIKHIDGHYYKCRSAGGFVWKYKEVA